MEYKIEMIRRELLKTAEERGMSSKETVKLSVELDHLLNLHAYDQNGSGVDTCILESTIQLKNKKLG
ncbi:aspartyl-phosphate phosphatase Spo0E family protein [Sporosarcina sp. BI001-red]|nr:aspartyl-phosphate phosphatase Spo0E family protein [Sporosarcina sp. BI001-red]